MTAQHATEELVQTCILNARALLGLGWDHVSKDIQWGLVSEQILSLCFGIDGPTLPASTVKRCISDARDTLGEGWSHMSTDIQWGLIATRLLDRCLQLEQVPGGRCKADLILIEGQARKLVFEP
jgi:hypothetical protein